MGVIEIAPTGSRGNNEEFGKFRDKIQENERVP